MPHFLARGVDAGADLKHVDDLRQQSDPRIHRNVVRSGAGRKAAAVPMLIQILDALRDGFGKPHFSRDLRAAVTARLDQLFGRRPGGLERGDQRADALRQPGFQSGVRQNKAKRLRQAAVDQFGVVFEAQVVGHVKLADARRVAAAAEVLQEQRVIELPYFGLAQTDLAADMDSDPTTADAVAGRLALDHIQCVAECAEQLGQDDLLIVSGIRRGAHRGVIRKSAVSRRRNTLRRQSTSSPHHMRLNVGFHRLAKPSRIGNLRRCFRRRPRPLCWKIRSPPRPGSRSSSPAGRSRRR